MKQLTVVLLVLLSSCLVSFSPASINPDQIVVIYNGDFSWNTGAKQSRAVADYYCATRGVTSSNKLAVTWDQESADLTPGDFLQVFGPLRDYLDDLPGFNPSDPSTDPVRAIELC